MSILSQDEVDEIIYFVVEHYKYKFADYKRIYQIIVQHAVYDTIMVVRGNDGNIAAVVRWNILPTGQDALVLDVIIHPDYRHQSILHRMLIKGLKMYPEVRYLIFERADKNKPFKKIPVSWLLKRRF